MSGENIDRVCQVNSNVFKTNEDEISLNVLLVCSFNKVIPQSNKIACDTVQFHLNVIKQFVSGKNPDRSMRRTESIAFLEKLTGIDGSGEGTDIGKYAVTLTDYNKWNDWFKKNKKNLNYNEITRKIELVE